MYYPKKSYLTLRLDTERLQQSLLRDAPYEWKYEYWYSFVPQLVAFPRIKSIFTIANRLSDEQQRKTALLHYLSNEILKDISSYEDTCSLFTDAKDKSIIEEIKRKLRAFSGNSEVIAEKLILTNDECECLKRFHRETSIDGRLPITYYQAIINFSSGSIIQCLIETTHYINQEKEEKSKTDALRTHRYRGFRPISHDEGQAYTNRFGPALKQASQLTGCQPISDTHYYYSVLQSQLLQTLPKNSLSINFDPISEHLLQQTQFVQSYSYGSPDSRVHMRSPVAVTSSILTIENVGSCANSSSLYFFNMDYTYGLCEIFDPVLAEKINVEARLNALAKIRSELPLLQIERDVVASIIKKYSANGALNMGAIAQPVNRGGANADELLMLAYSDERFAQKLLYPPRSDSNFGKLSLRFLLGGYVAIDKKVIMKRLGIISGQNNSVSDDLDSDYYISRLIAVLDTVIEQDRRRASSSAANELSPSLQEDEVVARLLAADSNTIFSVLTALEPSYADALIRHIPVIHRLSREQLMALATRPVLPRLSTVGPDKSVEQERNDALASASLVRNILDPHPSIKMSLSGFREYFSYYRNHPSHNLTQDDFIEISRVHPWLWKQGELFDQSSWLQHFFDWKWLGRSVLGSAWRDRMASDTIAKMLQDKAHPARGLIVSAMVRDSHFAKRIFSSTTVKNNPSLQSTILVLLNLEQATLRHKVSSFTKPINESLKAINRSILLLKKAKSVELVSPLFESAKLLRKQLKHTLLGDSSYILAPDGLHYAVAIIDELKTLTAYLPTALNNCEKEKKDILVAELIDLWLLSPEVRTEVAKYPFIFELMVNDEDVLAFLNSNPVDTNLLKEVTPECLVTVFTKVPKYRGYILEYHTNKLVQSNASLSSIPAVFIRQIILATEELNKIEVRTVNPGLHLVDLNKYSNNIDALKSVLTSQRQLLGGLNANDEVDAGIVGRIRLDGNPDQLLEMLIAQQQLHCEVVEKLIKLSLDSPEKKFFDEIARLTNVNLTDCYSFLPKILALANANRIIQDILLKEGLADSVILACMAQPALIRRLIAEATYDNQSKLLSKCPMLAPFFAEVYVANATARQTMLKISSFRQALQPAQQASEEGRPATKLFLALVNHLLSTANRDVALLSRMRTVEKVTGFPEISELPKYDPFDQSLRDRIPPAIKEGRLEYFVTLPRERKIEHCGHADNLDYLVKIAAKSNGDGGSILFNAFPEVAYIIFEALLKNKSDFKKESNVSLALQAVREIDVPGLSVLFHRFPEVAYLLFEKILQGGHDIQEEPFNKVVRQILRVKNLPNLPSGLLKLCQRYPYLLTHIIAREGSGDSNEIPLLHQLLSTASAADLLPLMQDERTRNILVTHMTIADWDRLIREFLDASKITNLAPIDWAKTYIDLYNARVIRAELSESDVKKCKVIQERMVIVFPELLDAMLLGSSPLLIHELLDANPHLMPVIIPRLQYLYLNTSTMKALVDSCRGLRGVENYQPTTQQLTDIFTRKPKNGDLLLKVILSNEEYVLKLLDGFRNREILLFFRQPENKVFADQIFSYPGVNQLYRQYLESLSEAELVQAYFSDEQEQPFQAMKVELIRNSALLLRLLNNASVAQLTTLIMNEPQSGNGLFVGTILGTRNLALKVLNDFNNIDLLKVLGDAKNQSYVSGLSSNGSLQQVIENLSPDQLTKLFEQQPIGSPLLFAILDSSVAVMKLVDGFNNIKWMQHLLQVDNTTRNSPLHNFAVKHYGKDSMKYMIDRLVQHDAFKQAFARHTFFSQQDPFNPVIKNHRVIQEFCEAVLGSEGFTVENRRAFVEQNPGLKDASGKFAVGSKAMAAQQRSGLLRSSRPQVASLPLPQPASGKAIIVGSP